MLVVTARLFKDNQLVGYRLSDGQSTQDLTKQQAWMYAKNKQIFNVVATGTEQDPGLSGIDGFELKSLPQIKWQEKSDLSLLIFCTYCFPPAFRIYYFVLDFYSMS